MADHPHKPQHPDWQDWIDRIGNPDVSEQELRDFQQLLETSPEYMDDYLEVLLTETSLEMKDGLLVTTPPQPVVNTTPEPSFTTAKQERKLSTFYLPIAASVVLLIGLAFLLGQRLQPVQVDTPVASHVATITDSDKVADAAGLRIGTPLQTGDIEVPAGSEIGIAMRGGARLEINGPAKLRIDGPENVFLHSGRVQTYAPEYAHGFAIDTDEGEIVDLGTRFVTTSGTELGTEIHVIDGLVKARTSADSKEMFYIGGEQAAILKNGKMLDTEFLARRLNVPINPNLEDSDSDGVANLVEAHYGTNVGDPKSVPAMLRVAEPFQSYTGDNDAAQLHKTGFRGTGKISHWHGSGRFLKQGLQYQSGGKSLLSSGGCLETTGEKGVGAVISLDDKELPKDGVIYISFLMQQPNKELNRPFSGLIFYDGEYREQLFVGELSVADSYGSRYAESDEEDVFAIPTDDKTHLFVIRIDLTRYLTDVFVDPPLGQRKQYVRPQKRYQNAPPFDRMMLRSGSDSGSFSVRFDELRIGLSWDAVLPVKP